MNKKFFSVILGLLIFFSCNTPENQNTNQETNKPVTIDTAVSDGAPDAVAGLLKNGETITKYSNGLLKTKGTYRAGKRIGQWMSWYESGQPWSENFYENGLKNGKTIAWFGNGKIRYEGYFTNDKKTGIWKFYNEKGEFVKEENYGK